MDLNTLLRRHKLSPMQAHVEFASDYAKHIHRARRASGARQALAGAVT